MDAYTRAIAAGSMPQALSTAAQPFLTNTAELERTRQLDHYLMSELGPQRFQAIKSQVPNWDALPDYMKAAYAASSMGVPPVTMPGMAMMPRLMSAGTMGSQAPPGSMEYGTDKPVDPNTRYRVMTLPMTGETMWQPETAQVGITQTPGGLQSSNLQTGQQVAPIQGAIPPVMNTPKTATTPTGAIEQYTPAGVASGTPPVTVPGAENPQFVPHVTNSLRSISTTDENNNPVTTLAPVQSVSQRGTPSLPSTAPNSTHPTAPATNQGSGRTFPKPFTPEQVLKGQQQLGQYNMAIGRIQDIQSQLPILNSMIESGKLSIETDSSGLLRSILNRAMPMTPAEAKFVGNFRTMMEDINLLRGPMGATGFRGPEAWAALQAQRGQLLAKPEITKQVLTNTLTALKAQQQPLAQRFSGQTGTPGSVNPVVQMFHDGGNTYHIPADKVEEFKRDHPKAQ